MLLSTDLFSALRKDIIDKKYARGFKLTEQMICSQYKVSRTPVREALSQLEAEGLIETIPNRGAFVLGISEQEIKDIFELRKPYEMLAVKWAVERMTDDELETLEESFDFMEFYTGKNDIEKMMNINTNFHRIIYAAAHSRMLSNLLTLYQQYTEAVKKSRVFESGYLVQLLEEHREIFDAIKNKDAPLGMQAMEKHMDNSMKRCYNIINGRL